MNVFRRLFASFGGGAAVQAPLAQETVQPPAPPPPPEEKPAPSEVVAPRVQPKRVPRKPPPKLESVGPPPLPLPPPNTASSDPWDRWDQASPKAPELEVPLPPTQALDVALDSAYRKAVHGSTDFVGIRKWQQGDDARRVNWRATRRTGEVVVNDLRDSPSTSVMLLADAGLWAHEDPRSQEMRRCLETLGTLLAGAAGRNRDAFGLLVCSDKAELAVRPGAGEKQAQASIDALLRFRPNRAETDPKVLVEQLGVTAPQGALVFYVSDRPTEEVQDALRDLSQRFQVVHVQLARSPGGTPAVARRTLGAQKLTQGWLWEDHQAPSMVAVSGKARPAPASTAAVEPWLLSGTAGVTEQLVRFLEQRRPGAGA